MYRVDNEVGPAIAILRNLRQRVAAIREPVFEAVREIIAPAAVEKAKTAPLLPDPGPVVTPFGFASPRSRAWYFWAKRTGQIPGQSWDDADGNYERTDTAQQSWGAQVDVRANEGFMRLYNDATDSVDARSTGPSTYAAALIGDNPVEGHAETGWGIDERVLDDIMDDVADDVLNAIDLALQDFGS